MRHIENPKGGEFPPYDDIYITPLPDDGLLLRHLKENFEAVKKLVLSLPPDNLIYSYAPGKWTIKEILVHIVDDERDIANIIEEYESVRNSTIALLDGLPDDAFTRGRCQRQQVHRQGPRVPSCRP